jgi:hypothetical protein
MSLADDFRRDGLPVRAAIKRRRDRGSFCMIGPVVEVLWIRRRGVDAASSTDQRTILVNGHCCDSSPGGVGCVGTETTGDVVERAGLPFPEEPLRALDAIHLASALLARGAQPGLQLLSLDDRVRRSAEASGFQVLPTSVG